MRTRYEVYLDGTPLSAVDPAILVTDVEECAPREALLSAAYARGHGTHLLSRRRESLSVRVSFMIREYDPARRKAAAALRRWPKASLAPARPRAPQSGRVAARHGGRYDSTRPAGPYAPPCRAGHD